MVCLKCSPHLAHVANILGMQNSPSKCLRYCTSLLTDPYHESLTLIPLPDPHRIQRCSSYFIWFMRPHAWPLMTSLASSFAAPLNFSGLFPGVANPLRNINIMSQIYMFVEFCIKIHEVLDSVHPSQGLQLELVTIPGPHEVLAATRTIHTCPSLWIFDPSPCTRPFPTSISLGLTHLSDLSLGVLSFQKTSLAPQDGAALLVPSVHQSPVTQGSHVTVVTCRSTGVIHYESLPKANQFSKATVFSLHICKLSRSSPPISC